MPLWFAYLSQSCWLSSIMFLTGTSIFLSWWLSVFLLASCMLWKPWSSTCPPVWFLRHWNPVNPSLMQFYSGMSVMKLSPLQSVRTFPESTSKGCWISSLSSVSRLVSWTVVVLWSDLTVLPTLWKLWLGRVVLPLRKRPPQWGFLTSFLSGTSGLSLVLGSLSVP